LTWGGVREGGRKREGNKVGRRQGIASPLAPSLVHLLCSAPSHATKTFSHSSSSSLPPFLFQAAEPTGKLGIFNPFPSVIFFAQSITWFIYGCQKVRQGGRKGGRRERGREGGRG